MDAELKVGIAGLGAIGRTHIDRINNTLQGARVVAATDASPEFGKAKAREVGVKYFENENDMIASGGIQALIVTAGDNDHERYVMAGLKAGIYVFCEKPLAPDAKACQRIIDAEIAGGKRLVQVGFMRRYDPGYRQLKGMIDSGDYGRPLMIHSAHRNPAVDSNYDTPMAITSTLIHEIDTLRWLVGEDYATVEMVIPRQTRHTHDKLLDPQIMILTSKSGIRMDIECFVNCRVGYDIQCEVCCEEGFLRLPDLSAVHVLANAARSTAICSSWSERFIDAYNIEFQSWIDSVRADRAGGPSSWDGLTAIVAGDAAQVAREEGRPVDIVLPECPAMYR